MSYETTENPLPGIEARPGSGHFGIFDYGAHVWSYQPDGAAPVLFISSKTDYSGQNALRGGVPVIFPWFAKGRDGSQELMHGIARLHTWHLNTVKDTLDRDGRLIVEYLLDSAMTHGETGSLDHYTASLRAKFTPEYLGISLQITNTGDEPITFEEALHTYLSVGDVSQASVEGLDGVEYFDKVAGERGVQDGVLTVSGEVDRIYAHTGQLTVVDPVIGRNLVVTKSGSASTIVWNPGPEKAAAMEDFADGECPTMICIEAGNVGDEAVTLLPGETHTLKQRITLA